MNLKEYEKTTPSLIIKREWDKEKNQAESLESLTYGSHKRVWWICKQGHSWQASIKDRLLKNEGCPYCKNRKVLSGFNDLVTFIVIMFAVYNTFIDFSMITVLFGMTCLIIIIVIYREIVQWMINYGVTWMRKLFITKYKR